MKRYILKAGIIFIILAISLQAFALADVFTTQKTEGMSDCIYVAGSPDAYPIEYYDAETEKYSGIIPDLLELISKSTELDFVYINGNKESKEMLAENLQVEIVSSAQNIPDHPYYKNYAELVSYTVGNEVLTSGIVFTTIADDDTVSRIKLAIDTIPVEKKNGIFLKYSDKSTEGNYKWLIFAIIVSCLLLAFVVMLILRIRRIQKNNMSDKMTDQETGMGNLQYFIHHFKHSIGDVTRNLYYLAYIILDSSYLRTYHGESSFDDMLKYTASILLDHTGDREISARITENGFAFAFQATNDEDAKKRLDEIINKLNNPQESDNQNEKLVFHAATYHLNNADKNCEILLFNLRKNCNKIIGTDTQIIYCDVQSMNRIQEEKRISESLLNGFEHNEFKMYLQFIVDNKTKQVVSAEALSRWDSPQKGLIGPGKYIEDMEMAGFISRHDFYMFDLACRQLEKWSGTDLGNISISCNFTRITLSEENFIDRLKMISNGYSFDKSKLAIEITEDVIEKNREIATQNVVKCKELGFSIYLDDLCSGYTSLANLCDYPIDVVKIDRDILLKTETNRGKDLFSGIIALAHSLNIKVICEGVETPEQNALVTASDCDFIQGWYYAKALPLEECASFIERYKNQ